jgi:hypothetical protein
MILLPYEVYVDCYEKCQLNKTCQCSTQGENDRSNRISPKTYIQTIDDRCVAIHWYFYKHDQHEWNNRSWMFHVYECEMSVFLTKEKKNQVWLSNASVLSFVWQESIVLSNFFLDFNVSIVMKQNQDKNTLKNVRFLLATYIHAEERLHRNILKIHINICRLAWILHRIYSRNKYSLSIVVRMFLVLSVYMIVRQWNARSINNNIARLYAIRMIPIAFRSNCFLSHTYSRRTIVNG